MISRAQRGKCLSNRNKKSCFYCTPFSSTWWECARSWCGWGCCPWSECGWEPRPGNPGIASSKQPGSIKMVYLLVLYVLCRIGESPMEMFGDSWLLTRSLFVDIILHTWWSSQWSKGSNWVIWLSSTRIFSCLEKISQLGKESSAFNDDLLNLSLLLISCIDNENQLYNTMFYTIISFALISHTCCS